MERFTIRYFQSKRNRDIRLIIPRLEINELADIWIMSRFNKTIGQINNYFSSFRFNTAAKTAYDFIWKDYCDWYLEMIKPRLGDEDSPEEAKEKARQISGYILLQILRLLHPIMPFVTEEIYHLLPDVPETVVFERTWLAGADNYTFQRRYSRRISK